MQRTLNLGLRVYVLSCVARPLGLTAGTRKGGTAGPTGRVCESVRQSYQTLVCQVVAALLFETHDARCVGWTSDHGRARVSLLRLHCAATAALQSLATSYVS